MRTIETTAQVTEDRKLMGQAPPEVTPGRHRILIIMEDVAQADGGGDLDDFDDFPAHDWGTWPANVSLRREDMYDDWSR